MFGIGIFLQGAEQDRAGNGADAYGEYVDEGNHHQKKRGRSEAEAVRRVCSQKRQLLFLLQMPPVRCEADEFIRETETSPDSA